MARKRQSGRMSTGGGRPPPPPPPPPTYNERRKAGGEKGPRTIEERAFLVKDFVNEAHGPGALTPPQWFQDRFPIYPAYKFTVWEVSFINEEPGYLTCAIFERCLQQTGGPSHEAYWTEKAAYAAIELALSSLGDDFIDRLIFYGEGEFHVDEWVTEDDSEDEDGDSRLSERSDN
eukprot:jgi/Botrbrau1/17874/Bobra.0404s0002.1